MRMPAHPQYARTITTTMLTILRRPRLAASRSAFFDASTIRNVSVAVLVPAKVALGDELELRWGWNVPYQHIQLV